MVFGNIPLGTRIIKLLEAHSRATIEAVVCQKESLSFDHHAFSEEPGVYEYAKEKNIDILELTDLSDLFLKDELYLGISARNNQILHGEHLEVFKKGVVNCHGGLLPAYRGLNSANFAIIDDVDEFGGTIHYMTEDVDAGPIIDRDWFNIEDDATAYDVFIQVTESLYRLIERNLDSILTDTEDIIEQDTLINEGEPVEHYSRGALNEYREVSPDWSLERIDRYTRAFSFPGHEPAYIQYDGRKIYLTLDW